MRNRNILIALALLLAFAAVPAARAQAKGEAFVKNELLVRFADGIAAEAAADVHDRLGARVAETLGDRGWQRVVLPDGLAVDEAMKRYRTAMAVTAVQPNYYYRLTATPNDPEFPLSGLDGLRLIKAPQAWDIATGSPSVVVAVLDTGARLTHSDLAANLWTNPGETPGNGADDDGNGFTDDVYGWDFRFNDNDPSDQHGHGTHVAGTIGAVGNNGIGVVGVNWNVRLMTVKIYSATGSDTTSAMLVNAYNYVRIMRQRGINIRVTNNSYGGCQEACGYDQATKDAIDALGEAGVLNVFAAGNSGTNNDVAPFFPSSYTSPSILSVGASTANDARAGFSNFGAISVDLAAPGVSIRSTTFGSDASYGSMSGTSMATPHVAGAAALLAAHDPSLSAASLKATLMNTVDAVPVWSGLTRTGGRLNVFAALTGPTTCSAAPMPAAISVPTKGGVFSLPVNALSNCEYLVRSNDRWIKVESADTAAGGGQVRIRVTLNRSVSRTGSITVGGQPVSISQVRGGAGS